MAPYTHMLMTVALRAVGLQHTGGPVRFASNSNIVSAAADHVTDLHLDGRSEQATAHHHRLLYAVRRIHPFVVIPCCSLAVRAQRRRGENRLHTPIDLNAIMVVGNLVHVTANYM